MKASFKTIIAALAILGLNTTLHAQTDTTASSYNESVIVVGDYNPVLDGVTEKVNLPPAVNDNISETLQPTFNYNITPRRISSLTPASGIKAAKVLGSPTRLYNNYLRFGVGHDFAAIADINPLLDLYYTSTRHDNYAYGARLFHNTDVTTFGRADDSQPSSTHFGRTRETDTRFDIFGKYILNKQHLFSANLAFDRQYGRYYGFSDSTLFRNLAYTRDSISFSDYAFAYNNLALNLGAQSLNTDAGKLGYDANLGLSNFWGRYDFSQFSMDLDANIHYGFPLFSKYKAIAYLRTKWQGFRHKADAPATIDDLPLGYNPVTPLPDTLRSSSNLFQINPYVDFLFSGFKFHAGLSFGFNAYNNDQTTHNLFPDLSVAKSFANNAMSLAVGFKGDYIANDWNTIRLTNPFVAPAPQTQATVDDNLYAYLRINFSKKLILNITVDNHFYQNAIFFQLDPAYRLNNVFTPYYVDYNEADFAANFTFVNDEMITMTLGAIYNLDYNIPTNTIILHDPNFTAHFDVDLNYKDKWLFTLQTLFVSSMDAEYQTNPTTGLNQVTQTIPAHFAIGLGAEYVHSRALSFFAHIDNLTAQRYYLWANYPAQRFNLLLGLTYTIPTKR